MSEETQGLERYTPTRLEWMSTLLNILFQKDNIEEDRFTVYYAPGSKGNSIRILVNSFSGVDKEKRDESIESAKKFVEAVASDYGWDSWVEVEININEF